MNIAIIALALVILGTVSAQYEGNGSNTSIPDHLNIRKLIDDWAKPALSTAENFYRKYCYYFGYKIDSVTAAAEASSNPTNSTESASSFAERWTKVQEECIDKFIKRSKDQAKTILHFLPPSYPKVINDLVSALEVVTSRCNKVISNPCSAPEAKQVWECYQNEAARLLADLVHRSLMGATINIGSEITYCTSGIVAPKPDPEPIIVVEID